MASMSALSRGAVCFIADAPSWNLLALPSLHCNAAAGRRAACRVVQRRKRVALRLRSAGLSALLVIRATAVDHEQPRPPPPRLRQGFVEASPEPFGRRRARLRRSAEASCEGGRAALRRSSC